jgi:hypothetical protein
MGVGRLPFWVILINKSAFQTTPADDDYRVWRHLFLADFLP